MATVLVVRADADAQPDVAQPDVLDLLRREALPVDVLLAAHHDVAGVIAG